MSFIILESITKFWVVVSRLTLNGGLESGTTSSELENFGCNHMDAGLCMWLEAYNHMEGLLWVRLGTQVI